MKVEQILEKQISFLTRLKLVLSKIHLDMAVKGKKVKADEIENIIDSINKHLVEMLNTEMKVCSECKKLQEDFEDGNLRCSRHRNLDEINN